MNARKWMDCGKTRGRETNWRDAVDVKIVAAIPGFEPGF
jgi:hypothetical protein